MRTKLLAGLSVLALGALGIVGFASNAGADPAPAVTPNVIANPPAAVNSPDSVVCNGSQAPAVAGDCTPPTPTLTGVLACVSTPTSATWTATYTLTAPADSGAGFWVYPDGGAPTNGPPTNTPVGTLTGLPAGVAAGGSTTFTVTGIPAGTAHIQVDVLALTGFNGMYVWHDLYSLLPITGTCAVTPPTATATSQTVCDNIVGTQTDNVTVTVGDVPAGVTGDASVVSHSPTSATVGSVPSTIGGNGSFLTGLTGIPGNATSASLSLHIAWSNGTSNNVTASTTLPGTCVIATPPVKPTPPSTPTASTPAATTSVVSAAPATAAAQPALAFTGAKVDAEVGLAVALLLAGSAMVLVSSRKRRPVKGVRELLGQR